MEDRDYKTQDILEVYRKDGSMIREKSRVLVEVWLDKIYPRLVDPDLPTSGLLEIGKALIELGDLKPKNTALQQVTGPGFSITINIPQSDTDQPVIEGTAEVVTKPRKSKAKVRTVTSEELDALPPMPDHIGIKVPDFELTDDLMGPVLETYDE
jgi:hypothetical protein